MRFLDISRMTNHTYVKEGGGEVNTEGRNHSNYQGTNWRLEEGDYCALFRLL